MSIPVIDPPERIGGSEGPIHLVLVHPEIPPNTGNVARLCAAIGAWMHLVEPLGFDLDHRKVKRAGLDYWPNVQLSVHHSLDALTARLTREHCFVFSKHATKRHTEVTYPAGAALIFGRETTGLSKSFRSEFEDRLVRIPILDNVRSLNLSNAVAVAAYEAVRQLGSVP